MASQERASAAENSRLFKTYRICSGTIKLTVGTIDQEVFTVHENVLRESSHFFRTALKKEWKEGQEREIKLPEDEPALLSYYINWLYSGIVLGPSDFENATESNATHHRCVDMYAFGEKVQDDAFCNAVISEMAKGIDYGWSNREANIPSDEATEAAYSKTMPSSPLRRFLVDIWVAYSHEQWLHGGVIPKHPDFARELAIAFVKDQLNKEGRIKGKLYDERQRWLK